MISASKTTYTHYNLKILRPKVTKNIKNLRKKFCKFPPRVYLTWEKVPNKSDHVISPCHRYSHFKGKKCQCYCLPPVDVITVVAFPPKHFYATSYFLMYKFLKTVQLKVQSNSVITNSPRPSEYVRYNRETL